MLLYFRTLSEQRNTFINSLLQAQLQRSLENWSNMDTRAFYGAKKVTHVSTLTEVNEAIENVKNVVNVVILPPEAGDSGSQESDVGDVADSTEKIFKPAGELKMEEDFESNEESETTLPSTRKKRFPKWKKAITSIKQV